MEIETGGGLLLAALAVVLILGPLTKRTCRGLGVPVSAGYIVVGLAMGALLRPAAGADLDFLNGVFATLAQLGVIALLFRVGLRSHTTALLDKLPDASLIWIGNVLGSAAVGFVVSHFIFHWSLETSLVIGTAFSATSLAVSLAVWDELGLADTDTGATLLDVAELDDLSAAVLLAVLLGTLPAILNGDGNLWFFIGTSLGWVLAKLAIFIIGCYLFAHYLEDRFTRFNRGLSDTPASLTISILGAGLAIAAVASALGFSAAIGALFAGLAFSRDPEAVRTDGSFTYFYEFLTPFFFIYIGMQTDVLMMLDALATGLVLLLAAAASKFVFTVLPALTSMSRQEALQLAVSMIPRAEIALVVIYECRSLAPGIVPAEVFAGMVLVCLGTSVLSPLLLRRMLTAG